MIGKLKGRVESIGEEETLLDVGGVCYSIFLSARSAGALPGVGEAASLLIDTHVREDHIHLYGFVTAEEQAWFRLLTTVQGVGAKMALAILSAFGAAELQQAILAKDTKLLTRANGVGPKLAERLVTELKNKAAKVVISGSFAPVIATASPAAGKGSKSSTPPAPATSANPTEEAISALVNLGYGRSEAYSAIGLAAGKSDSGALDDLIRLGLKELAR